MNPIVHTRTGPVRGVARDGVETFLGIPYAAAPVGELRFGAPQPPEQWSEVRDALEFGPTPPKPRYIDPIDRLLIETEVPGDDWLSVNVWAPQERDPAGRPVMVWIYGGAFVNGNSSIPVYDGTAFARDGVVFVSLNYRIGAIGFAHLPDAPPNRGLLDQVAALTWVRDNIAAFGGDPGNVTIFGESAGAMSVVSLMTMPRARGLFAKAIAESGTIQGAAEPADATLVSSVLAEAAGRAATAASLSTMDIPDLIAAQFAVSMQMRVNPDPARFGPSVLAASMAFVPIVDGDVLPMHPLAALAGGASADIPLLTGTTSDEYRLFLVPTGIAGALDEEALDAFTARLGIAPAVVALYRANRPGATPGDVLCALLTDAFFRGPALTVAEARASAGAHTWLYEFGWPSGLPGLGACHGLEIGFVFDAAATPSAEALSGPDAPRALATHMHKAWIEFARSGDPGWPGYDPSYPIMTFDATGSHLEHDPRADERTVWRA